MTFARNSKTGPQAARAAVIEAKALVMRQSGKSYQQIADEMGITLAQASSAVRRALARARAEATEVAAEMVALESLRMDALTAGLFNTYTSAPATKQGLKAAEILIKLMERRSKLFGLDSPAKTVNVTADVSPEASAKHLTMEQMAKMAAILEAGDALPDNSADLDEIPDYGDVNLGNLALAEITETLRHAKMIAEDSEEG